MAKWVNVRLILAIVTSLLDEAAVVAVMLWGLSRLGIEVPLWALITLVMAFGAFAVVSYRVGSRALGRPPLPGLGTMVGMRGRAVSPLAPEGMVRTNGELWRAIAARGQIDLGEEITVVRQEGFKLTVARSNAVDVKQTQ